MTRLALTNPPEGEERTWRSAVFIRGGPRLADDQDFYLGFTRGQWPIQIWADIGSAAGWAAEDELNRLVVGPIQIPADVPCFQGKVIPKQNILEEIEP